MEAEKVKPLKLNIKEMLKDFFRSNEIVVSSYFSIPFFPSGIGDNNHLLKFKRKIPKKLYVGVALKDDKDIQLGNFYFQKEKQYLGNVLKNVEFLKEFLADKLKELGIDYGMVIDVYSDIPRGYGLGFAGTFAASLAVIFYLLADKVSVNDIDNICNLEIFEEVYDFAFQIEKILKYNNTNGENSFLAFCKKKGPYIFWREGPGYKQYKVIDLTKKIENKLPIDMWFVVSGIPVDTQRVEKSIVYDKQSFNELKQIVEKFDIKNDFIVDAIKSNYDVFEKSIILLNLKLLNILTKVLDGEFDKVDVLIDVFNQHRYVFEIVGDYSDFVRLFIREFYKNASGVEKIGVSQLWGGRFGGGYFVWTKEKISRKTIKKVLSSIRLYYPDAEIIWANFDKQLVEYPMQVEQFLDEDITWQGFEKKIYILEDATTGLKKIITSVDEVKDKYDVLIDLDKGKLWIAGQKVNSSQIHSQRKLAEILLIALYNSKKWISNEEFYKSSYTQNFSEFTGKLVYPFKRLVEERLQKELVFDVKKDLIGFEVYFDPKKVKFGIVYSYN